jgi:hypothetical protein
MKKIIAAATSLVAIAALAVPAVSMAAKTTDASGNTTAANGDVTCRGDLSANVAGDLNVPAGQTCRIVGWISIDGDTTVQGNLHTFGQVEFDGKVRVNGGTFVVSNWGVHIHGSLKIVNSVGDNTTANNGFWSDYSPTVIDGKFTYTGNNGWFYAEGQNTIYGKTTIGGNTHPFSGAGLTTHGHSSIS